MASSACPAQIPVIIQLVVGSEMMPNGWTLVSFCQSFTILGGTLIVGWIADLSKNYKTLFYVTAGSAILSALVLMFMRHEVSQGHLKPRTLKTTILIQVSTKLIATVIILTYNYLLSKVINRASDKA